MKQIKVTPNERRRLQERFDVGENYVTQVLSYAKDGPTARRIRLAALEMGGRYVDPDFAPNCQTSYLGGFIIQTFGDDVVLRINRQTGDLTITHHGNVVAREAKASMAVWQSMAFRAQQYALTVMIRP